MLRTKLTTAREEVVEIVPNRRFSYELLSGFPFREYRADVDLLESDNRQTTIKWQASFYPRYAGTGWFWRLFMTQVLKSLAARLAAAGDHAAPEEMQRP